MLMGISLAPFAIFGDLGAVWMLLYFFFSSRRRHTRLQGDWSSDVCSSDLGQTDLLDGACEREGGQGWASFHDVTFLKDVERSVYMRHSNGGGTICLQCLHENFPAILRVIASPRAHPGGRPWPLLRRGHPGHGCGPDHRAVVGQQSPLLPPVRQQGRPDPGVPRLPP